MRALICKLMMLSLLFVSLEGVADVVIDGIPHGDESSHQAEFGHPLDNHDGKVSDTELDGEHCEHCCHGHSSVMTAPVVSLQTPVLLRDLRVARSPFVHNFAQAPPTPPPNI